MVGPWVGGPLQDNAGGMRHGGEAGLRLMYANSRVTVMLLGDSACGRPVMLLGDSACGRPVMLFGGSACGKPVMLLGDSACGRPVMLLGGSACGRPVMLLGGSVGARVCYLVRHCLCRCCAEVGNGTLPGGTWVLWRHMRRTIEPLGLMPGDINDGGGGVCPAAAGPCVVGTIRCGWPRSRPRAAVWVDGPFFDPGQRCGWPRRRPRAAVWVAPASTPGSGGCCYLL